MAPRQQPAAALPAAVRARIVPVTEAQPGQTPGPLARVSAAARPNTRGRPPGRCVTLGFRKSANLPVWSSWAALGGVIIALLNQQSLEGKRANVKT